jgi:hypothetical protein
MGCLLLFIFDGAGDAGDPPDAAAKYHSRAVRVQQASISDRNYRMCAAASAIMEGPKATRGFAGGIILMCFGTPVSFGRITSRRDFNAARRSPTFFD